MTVVLTGLSPQWEAGVATTLERAGGITVARRCADVSELLSVAEAGHGDCAVISSDLRGLDLSVVGRLRAAGLHIVGVHPSGAEEAERRLRQWSVAAVLAVDAPPEDFAAAVAGGTSPGGDDLESLVPGVDAPDPGHPAGSDDAARGSSHRDDGRVSRSIGWVPGGHRSATDPAEPHAKPELRGLDEFPNEFPDASTYSETSGHPSGDSGPEDQGGRGAGQPRIVAVWGPNGAPGRTTIAVNVASELASRGVKVLLVDADTYGGCVAQSLGLLDEAPGIAAACRSAEQGTLDVTALGRFAPVVHSRLRVLTGLPKADRWPEVRAAAFERVLELSRSLATVVIIDCGFCLEDDEELSYDTSAPRRNEATLTALALADSVLAVGGADPVGLQRFVRGLQELGSVPSPAPIPVINRVRASAVGGKPIERIADSLLRFAGLESVRYVPDDQAAVDSAMLAGRAVVEGSPESELRVAIADLASAVAPWTHTRALTRRRRWSLGRGADPSMGAVAGTTAARV